MTPLTRFCARRIPRILRVPVLALIYAGMVGGILMASRNDVSRIIYVDIRAGNDDH